MLSYPWKSAVGAAAILTAAVLVIPQMIASQLPPAASGQQITFARDIAPILQRSCQNCHRPGSVAPMSLLTYEEARPWAKAMKERVSLRSKPGAMPPWFIEKNVGIQQYKGDISLSEQEIDEIVKWADNGAPQGNPADMPAPLKFRDASEWEIGTPDLIVSSPSITMKATAPDFWSPLGDAATGLTEDRYVAAVEVKEVNDLEGKSGRQTIGGHYIFHHLVWSAAGTGIAGLADTWPVHEVGRNADFFDPDAGKLLKAGSRIVFSSAHLHAAGAETKARVDIGFKFHPKGYQPKKRPAQTYPIATLDLDIRPMEANQKVEASTTLPANVRMVVFEPHMHAAGVRMCLDAIWMNTVQTLSCSGYNHNWVRVYSYADSAAPLLPKGTVLRVTGYFDNTPNNKNVVDPRNWSGLGHRSIDNMMVDIGQVIMLSDDEFEREMAERRQALNVKEGQNVLGCPLCGSSRPAAIPAGTPR